MLCCSYDCEKYTECAHACINNPGSTDYVVDWARNGSCSIQYINGQVVTNENYDCGAIGKYAMYTPYVRLTIPEHYHQVTIDEWIEEKEKQDKEKAKMNDNIDVRVKVIPYTKDISLDFDNPLYVNSMWPHDELVELEHNGHKVIVSESELVKAAKLCANNRW